MKPLGSYKTQIWFRTVPLVYPEGNWVEIGPDTPYQIIGASGFGKPILERSLQRNDTMPYAFKVGILAFDATRLCAADVDFPSISTTTSFLSKKNSIFGLRT